MITVFLGTGLTGVAAQELSPYHTSPLASDDLEKQLVTYPASFFDRYRPTTALDMVEQIPGFQIDNGDANRGFGTSIGNILINDNYPSVKQDRPSSALDRVPASQVERIELIRGQVRGIDLFGQPLVVNVVLRENKRATIRWQTYFEHNNHGPTKPGANMSLADQWADIEYLVGLKIEREASGELGPEKVVDASGALTEIRNDERNMTGIRVTGNLNAGTLLGRTYTHFNTNFMYKTNNSLLVSRREPQLLGGQARTDFVDERETQKFIEIGMDAEHKLQDELVGKGILLFFYQEYPLLATRRVIDSQGIQTQMRIADSLPITTESIGRLEFDWTRFEGHSVQFNLEGAFNSVDNSLVQTQDNGDGPVVVDVPGANTRVEEVRGDFRIKDVWSFGTFQLDYGIGAETSTITQTGDAEQKRSFFFVKPEVVLTYSPDQIRQTRFRLAREVSQLNFNDFVSAAVFEDNDLALGNPDLQPESIWVSEISHERRFGQDSVVGVTAFYHRISDVEDLLPITDVFEAPGNIGDGKRWGVEFESTVPLEWLGWPGAKLDLKGRWQDSSVTDPVAANDRVLSAVGGFAGPPSFKFNSENEFTFNISFRQDLEAAGVAWGLDVARHAERPLFRVNELDVYHEGTYTRAFVETARWFGMKIRLQGSNLLDYDETRDRSVYVGRREISPIDFMLLRSRKPGRRFRLTLSGTF